MTRISTRRSSLRGTFLVVLRVINFVFLFITKKFILLENFTKFELQNSNLPSVFLRSCESRMTVTTMASQEEEEAGSDKLSDEEVFSETSRKAASHSEYSSTK